MLTLLRVNSASGDSWEQLLRLLSHTEFFISSLVALDHFFSLFYLSHSPDSTGTYAHCLTLLVIGGFLTPRGDDWSSYLMAFLSS